MWRRTNVVRSTAGTSGAGHGRRTARSAADDACSRSDDMGRCLLEVRYEPYGSNGYEHTLRSVPCQPKLRLGPISYLVLGIIAYARTVHPIWPQAVRADQRGATSGRSRTPSSTPSPSVSPTPGLLEETREDTTSSGAPLRDHLARGGSGLDEWLNESVATPTEYRDLGLLKLFFAELAEPEAVARARRASRLPPSAPSSRSTRRSRRASRTGRSSRHRLLTVRARASGSRAPRAEFWEELATEPPGTDRRRNGR